MRITLPILLSLLLISAHGSAAEPPTDVPPRYKLVEVARTAPRGYQRFLALVVSPDTRYIVGVALKADNTGQLFRWKQDSRNPSSGTFRALAVGRPEAVNNAGVVVGYGYLRGRK